MPTGGVFARASLLFLCVSPASKPNGLRRSAGSGLFGILKLGPCPRDPRPMGRERESQRVFSEARRVSPKPERGAGAAYALQGHVCARISMFTKSCSDSNAVLQLAEWPRHLTAPSPQGYSSRDSEGTQSCVRCQKHQDG